MNMPQKKEKESTVKIDFLHFYLRNQVNLESELLEEPLVFARLVPGNNSRWKQADEHIFQGHINKLQKLRPSESTHVHLMSLDLENRFL